MKQFSLEKYLENPSRKVVTRDGKEVALFGSASGNERYPVKGMIEKSPTTRTWTETGISYCNGNPQSDDLFFADEEEELTEFEKKLQIIISEASYWTSDDGSISTCCQFGDKEIKKISGQLLDLARKELQPEFDEEMERMLAETDKVVYQKGQQDALKDLPKWKKAKENKEFDKHVLLFEDEERIVLTTELYKDEYYIEVDDLKTLPKEE